LRIVRTWRQADFSVSEYFGVVRNVQQTEATNALDLASEREIWRFIRAWLPGAMLFVAAHRTENFVDIEREIHVRNGRVESVA
jgi:hypothetical protein